MRRSWRRRRLMRCYRTIVTAEISLHFHLIRQKSKIFDTFPSRGRLLGEIATACIASLAMTQRVPKRNPLCFILAFCGTMWASSPTSLYNKERNAVAIPQSACSADSSLYTREPICLRLVDDTCKEGQVILAADYEQEGAVQHKVHFFGIAGC